MQPTGLGNPCPVFGPLENEVRGFTGEWLGAIPAGKEPGSRAIDAPIRPQVLQEAWGEQGFTVFLALALGQTPKSVFENSSCKPVIARCTTIPPCYGPTLSSTM